MKSVLRKIHLWLSIPAGIMIIIMCLTGAILTFENDVLEMKYPEKYFIEVPNKVHILPEDSLITLVNAQLQMDTVKSIKLPKEDNRVAVGRLTSGKKSFVYVNPYNGNITGFHNATKGFFADVMKLHRWLLLPDREVGRIITGVSTVFFIVILITGFARVCQIYKCKWKMYFSIKKDTSICRQIIDIHNVAGVSLFLILLILSLTGLMWSFKWYNQAVAWLFNVEDTRAMMSVVKSIHLGTWGGMFSKIITFISCIGAVLLVITGYYMYIKRLKRKY